MRPAPSVPPPPTPTSTGATKKKKKRNEEDGEDGDQVWAHFPPELRAYVRAEYAKSVRPPSVQGLVQHMEQYGWRARTTTEAPPPVPPNPASPQPPFPFDAQLFADPAFAIALEQLTLAGGPKHPPPDEQYDEYFSEDDDDDIPPPTAPAKKKKKKKRKAAVPPPPPPPPMPALPHPQQPQRRRAVPPSSRAAGKQPMTFTPAPAPAPQPPNKPRTSPPSSSTSNTKLWNTNSLEERQRIKEFWLGLAEQERRDLVKVEREAVLKKMKEQQKHSCACAVCGRKRAAIEEELEVLYDAYYEELEQYANIQQRFVASGGTTSPPVGPGPFPGSVELDDTGAVVNAQRPISQHENFEDEGEEYEDEEEEGDEEDDDEEEDKPNGVPTPPSKDSAGSFLNFSNSLTVTGASAIHRLNLYLWTAAGNILTVADDLLKNDGQKFLEMMEQLAEHRTNREDEAADSVAAGEDEDDEDDEEEEEEGDDYDDLDK
ncbi:hypothetical protein FRC11_011713, partial [Ceratobasidium sp. 423]